MPSDTERTTVGVVYTGGTFGMVPSARGLAPSADLPERLGEALAGDADLPALEWIDPGRPPVASSDIVPAFWHELADAIAAAAEGCDGFVVIHGTDTLAYTGSALSFLLAGLGRPVVVTGASAPLGQAGSNAADNFRLALAVATSGGSDEVTLAFGDRVLRANRATKRHGGPDNPFASPCLAPLAERTADGLRWSDVAPPPAAGSALARRGADRRDPRIAVLPVYPGIRGDTVRAVAGTAPDGIVLEGYSAGVGPGDDADFVAALRETVDGGTVVGAIAQGRHGHIRMGKYASSTPIAEAGVVGGADMTREAALTKLHALLAAGLTPGEAADAFGRDLRGELTGGEA